MVLINSNNNLESRALSDLIDDFITTGDNGIDVEDDEDDD
jgi:hypothetical protein